MEYELGQFFREEYGHLLGDDYTENKVEIRSTDTVRTLMSAQLVAAGLWPPSETQKWNLDLNWQPIPIFAKPFPEEDVSLKVPENALQLVASP